MDPHAVSVTSVLTIYVLLLDVELKLPHKVGGLIVENTPARVLPQNQKSRQRCMEHESIVLCG